MFVTGARRKRLCTPPPPEGYHHLKAPRGPGGGGSGGGGNGGSGGGGSGGGGGRGPNDFNDKFDWPGPSDIPEAKPYRPMGDRGNPPPPTPALGYPVTQPTPAYPQSPYSQQHTPPPAGGLSSACG